MGCGSSALRVDTKTSQAQRASLDETLLADALKKCTNMEAVLFGTGESGKTTLATLFEAYSQPAAALSGVDDVCGSNGIPTPTRYKLKDDADVKQLLFENTVSCLQQLLQAAGEKKLITPEAVDAYTAGLIAFLDVGVWSKGFVDMCEELWKMPSIQTVVTNRHEYGYWILENYPYYMEHLQRFARAEPGITFEDKLRSRKRTTIISTTKPLHLAMTAKTKPMWRAHAEAKRPLDLKSVDGLNGKTGALPLPDTTVLFDTIEKAPPSISFALIDIGGQKMERSKWARYFTGVCAFIYVINLNGFGQWMFEERGKDQMVDSYTTLEGLANTKSLINDRFILVFTKTDLFKKQLTELPKLGLKITDFPFMKDYKHDTADPISVLAFIKAKFEGLLRPTQSATSYSICTVEPAQVFAMFQDIHHELVLYTLPTVVRTLQKLTGQ